MAPDSDQIYTQDYRHFDTLIWQVPTWSSAVFALTATAIGPIVSNAQPISAAAGFSARYLLGAFVGTMAFVLLLLSNVLFRFRLHQTQIILTPKPDVPKPPWRIPGGHRSLQLIVTLECAALFAATFLVFRIPFWVAGPIPFSLGIFFQRLAECKVKQEETKAQQKSTRETG